MSTYVQKLKHKIVNATNGCLINIEQLNSLKEKGEYTITIDEAGRRIENILYELKGELK